MSLQLKFINYNRTTYIQDNFILTVVNKLNNFIDINK